MLKLLDNSKKWLLNHPLIAQDAYRALLADKFHPDFEIIDKAYREVDEPDNPAEWFDDADADADAPESNETDEWINDKNESEN